MFGVTNNIFLNFRCLVWLIMLVNQKCFHVDGKIWGILVQNDLCLYFRQNILYLTQNSLALALNPQPLIASCWYSCSNNWLPTWLQIVDLALNFLLFSLIFSLEKVLILFLLIFYSFLQFSLSLSLSLSIYIYIYIHSGGARIWVEGGQNLYEIYAFYAHHVNI